MHRTDQTLISFFEHVAQKDPALLEKLALHEGFEIGASGWSFTLPVLHEFLCQQAEFSCPLAYKQFQKMLFQSAINQSMMRYGAIIEVAQNESKVDRSVYRLAWRAYEV